MEEYMDLEQLALNWQKTDDRSIRNEGRIKKLENEHEALHKLTTSVAVMAEKVSTMANVVDNLDSRVNSIEDKPAKRWDGLIDKIIAVVAGAVIGALLAKYGL